MHWLGIVIAFSSALLSMGLGRSLIRHYFPNLHDTPLDVVLIVLIIVGLGLTTIKHFVDQKEIKTLTAGVDLLNYREVSTLNPSGNIGGFSIHGMHSAPTPINDWNKKFAHHEGGDTFFECKPGAKEACLEVINKLPSYPFSYFFLAQCLKEENDRSWVGMAKKAKAILEKTTQIPGHKSDHDKVLERVTVMLRDATDD